MMHGTCIWSNCIVLSGLLKTYAVCPDSTPESEISLSFFLVLYNQEPIGPYLIEVLRSTDDNPLASRWNRQHTCHAYTTGVVESQSKIMFSVNCKRRSNGDIVTLNRKPDFVFQISSEHGNSATNDKLSQRANDIL